MSGKKLEQIEITRLNALGLGKKHWASLHDQWKKYGGKSHDGTYFINYGDVPLDSKIASESYRAFTGAIRNEVTSTVIEPGAGDLPISALNPAASMLLQYKKFMGTAHTKALVSNLSMEDANIVSGLVAMHALAVMSYISTSYARDGGASLDFSLSNLAKESIDRSGFLSLISEGGNFAFKALGLGTTTRYQSRSISGALTGPSVGFAFDALEVARKLLALTYGKEGEEFTTNDAKKFLRMVPYQNLFYIAYLDRQVTKQAALALGAEESEGL